MANGYPNRPIFWAHKLVRLLIRTCAAQEIGADGVWLVTIIAHTEDAKKYTAPVTYWNEQLQAVAGFSIGQLSRARAKAVEAGWLHYEPGGKGRVGRYWSTVPTKYADLPDGATDCDAAILFKTEQDTQAIQGNEEGDLSVQKWTGKPVSCSPVNREAQEKRKTSANILPCSCSPGQDRTEQGRDEALETELGGVTVPPVVEVDPWPLGKINPAAVYKALTERHLSSARSMLEWYRRQLSAAEPVLKPTREDQLLCVCCAMRATEGGVGKPVGKFVRLVQRRAWDEVGRYRDLAQSEIDKFEESLARFAAKAVAGTGEVEARRPAHAN